MLREMWHITVQLAPWLLLGAAIAGALHAWLPAGWMRRRLAGRGGVARAVALGVPLPLCSCGVIPVGLAIKKQGAGSGPAVGFLISTPQTGVDSILVTAAMLGWPLALFKVVVAIVTGLAGGWITRRVDPDPPLAVVEPTPPTPATTARSALARAAAHAEEVVGSVWRWLVVGVIVSAAIAAWAPADALRGVASHGPAASMAAALVVSLPLYVCATASVPIAAALVAGGLPMGAVIVFLMAGPATNLATIGAVYRGLGARALAVYLATIIAGSVGGGLLFDAFFPANTGAVAAAHDHAAHSWWAVASAAALLAWIARFAWRDAVAWRGERSSATDASPSRTIAVDGMSCGGCVAKLRAALLADAGVRTASVRLSPGEATVTGDVSRERLADLVRAAGFTTRG